MKRLSDFKPLESVILPELGKLNCSGLIVFVGPNSSGKSQLLRDLYFRLAGQVRKLVVATEIHIDNPQIDPLLDCLETEGYFKTVTDNAGVQQLQPRTMYLGTGHALSQISAKQARDWHKLFSDVQRKTGPSEFLNHFGRLLVTALFLDRRLNSLDPAGVIDFVEQSPQHDLHALHMNESAKQRLSTEMLNSFGRGVWLDPSRGQSISLKVSDEGVPSAEDRLEPIKMAAFRSIETEGDGMKSYVATCLALLLGRRPVCLIDEPELCLHPPQAYNLGRFIGANGTGTDTATFVATHSSHLLRGIIQATSDVQIVRMTRRDGAFSAHLVPPNDLQEALKRPTLRAESVLDGIFAQAVVVVEADGDRLVYQAAWETIQDEFRIDVHFSPVGGTGGIPDTCSLYRTLGIPIAVIADLDLLVDDKRMHQVLGALVDDAETRTILRNEVKALSEELRALPPTISARDVASQLVALSISEMDWGQRDDIRLKQQIGELRNAVDRMRSLKKGGVNALPPDLSRRISDHIQRLRTVGLFLVPLGELEEWLAGHDVGESKSKKRAWANAAAQKILQLGKQSGDVWEFISVVGRYVTSSLQSMGRKPMAVGSGTEVTHAPPS